MLVPYIRAKAEGFWYSLRGRNRRAPERLMLSMSAIALDGLGVPVLTGECGC